MAHQDNYQLLVEKLDQFIRKYYINQLIRGALYSVGVIVLLFLGMSLLEHYFYFSSGVRRTLFFSFIGVSGLALFQWVFLPILRYFRLGTTISHEQAATIIGSHFADVKDKLLNVLQLKYQSDSAADKDLILASVNQKTEEIKLVPFKSAINLSENRKYLRYALPPLLLFLILLFTGMIRDSSFRLLHSGQEFFKPAPFHFMVEEDDLSVVQFEDFPLSVKIEGDQLPNEVFINVDNVEYRLTKEAPDLFTYRFSNVQKNTEFRLFAGEVRSKEFELDVKKKPNVTGFEVKLDYPGYIGRKDEALNSVGDLVVPMGTKIDWIFNAENTDNIFIQFAGQNRLEVKRFSDDLFTFKKQAMKDEPYKLYISNQYLPQGDSISYSITVIPDLYPNITAEKFIDSTDNKLLYFAGEANDDYGLLSLSFNYRIKKAGGKQGELQTIKLRKPDTKQIRFDHLFDLHELALEPGDEVSYYFEVFDNDGVNGNKSARTNFMMYAMPTVEEYKAMADKNNDQIKNDLQKALEESRRIQEEMKRIREKLLQEKDLDWQNRKELEKLVERQKELEKKIEEAKQNFEENLKNQQEYQETDERIQEKQEQLQKLFDEAMNEEMKELMKKIEELLQKMEKDQALEMMEDFQFNNEDIEKELDRLQELFKQLEIEQKTQETIEELQKLAQEQEKLSEETKKTDPEKNEKGQKPSEEKQKPEQKQSEEQKQQENKNTEQNKNQEQQNKEQQNKEQENKGTEQPQSKQEELKEKQEDINEKFEEIKEQMKEIEQKNEELENPKEMENQDQQMQNIQQDLNKSQQQLQQQQNKKASESQKNAAEKMKDMANNMQMQMQQQEMEQMQEDMKALRQLLENLVGLSFDQEDLFKEFEKASINTPRYVELTQQQFKLQDDFRLVEDSLQALSKRLFQIESFVTDKVSEVKDNMRESLSFLEERQKPQAGNNQQRAMKNLNDLALMLSEMMNQMQQQMSAMMAGSQMCTNPGQSKQQQGQPQDKISQGQQQLNEQMRNAKERMEQQGKSQEEGGGMSSEEFAKMAAKQAALRKALRDKQKELQQRGQGNKELQDLIEQMDKVETDLVNKKLTNEMLKRQQDILTRLLEHEKAERERGMEEKRKAETASEKERKMPPSLEEYIKKREAEIEMYKTVSPTLKPYYKFLVEEYFKTLKTK
ncbi:MAG: DUF4175 family protein [Saprospiraceae bacterium]|nr:DUF4175 family protein [Saprospiraceae bacterium]